jgi:hypothetical protein
MLKQKELHDFAVNKLKFIFVKKPFPSYFDKTNERISEKELQGIYSEYVKINPDLDIYSKN